MPASKKRGGKKSHSQRVVKRNKNIADAKRSYEKLYTSVIQEHLNKINQKQNGTSES